MTKRSSILEKLLQAVIPVCAGINLEYYFSFVDPTGYGCGTKLPHNITSLLGVMDGAAQRSPSRFALADGRNPRAGAAAVRHRNDPRRDAADHRRQPRDFPSGQRRMGSTWPCSMPRPFKSITMSGGNLFLMNRKRHHCRSKIPPSNGIAAGGTTWDSVRFGNTPRRPASHPPRAEAAAGTG